MLRPTPALLRWTVAFSAAGVCLAAGSYVTTSSTKHDALPPPLRDEGFSLVSQPPRLLWSDEPAAQVDSEIQSPRSNTLRTPSSETVGPMSARSRIEANAEHIKPTTPTNTPPVTVEEPLTSVLRQSPRTPSPPTVESSNVSVPSLPELPTFDLPQPVSAKPLPRSTDPVEIATDEAALAEAMKPVNQLALKHVSRGFSLGDRLATFAARKEFLMALQQIAEARDVQVGLGTSDPSSHSQHLQRAITAMREAADFSPNKQGAENIDIAHLMSGHRTRLPGESEPGSALAALQQYLNYAQREFTSAVKENPVASHALTGLGKCCLNEREGAESFRYAEAIVYQTAALRANPRNHLAANELGVLYGHFQQWEPAKQTLLHALRVQPDAVTWQNLAQVHRMLGERELEQLALRERQILVASSSLPNVYSGVDGSPTVRWVGPQAFQGPPDDGLPPPAAVANRPQPPATTASPASSGKSWWNMFR